MSDPTSPEVDVAEVKGDVIEVNEDVVDLKEDSVEVETDTAAVNPADLLISEKVSAEKHAVIKETNEEVEATHNTFEMVQESPDLNVEDLFQETPSVSESVAESTQKEDISHVSENLSINLKSQEQIKDVETENVDEHIEPSDQTSIQEGQKETTDQIPEENNLQTDLQQNDNILEETDQLAESTQDEGKTTETEGVPTEEAEPSAMDVEQGGRKSMIPGIDELVTPVNEKPQMKETEIEHITVMEEQVSRVSLHEAELPEIRGLAELEVLERKESVTRSIIEEDWMDDDFLPSRRKSTRPSLALRKLLEEEDDEPFYNSRTKPSRGDISPSLGRIVTPFVEVVEDDNPPNTREEYYILFDKLTKEYLMIKMKNKFLQRKMGELFKKRKVEHALREEFDIQPDVIEKYQNQLDKLSHLLKLQRNVTVKITSQLDELQKERDIKDNERQIAFNKLINREKEIGFGLISTKTGKEIPNKVVEQLIRRQLNSSHETSVLRLKYITKRDEFAEKTAELKSLDNIGEDLSLMDYEQLKIENRSLADKLEEKEEELTKLRVKCRNAVQVMAHVREKAAALDADMDVLKEDFEEVNYEYIEVRERLNFCKTERDEIRNKTMKLKAESGLLTKPKLLLDMETSMEEAKLLEETLEKVKSEYNLKTQKIRALRKNIAYEMMMDRKPQKKKKKKIMKYYNARPTLVLPKLPTNVVDRLERIMKDSIKAEKLRKIPENEN